MIKATIDYQSYKSVQEKALPKFKYYAQCMTELKKILEEEIQESYREAKEMLELFAQAYDYRQNTEKKKNRSELPAFTKGHFRRGVE